MFIKWYYILTTAQEICPKNPNIVNSSIRLNVISITLISNSWVVLFELTVGMLAVPPGAYPDRNVLF